MNRSPAETRGVCTTVTTLDVARLVMAILVVGIHAEPFRFNLWQDRAFGILTRMCVPFFFVSGSYLFWRKNGSPAKYIRRLLILYVLWVLIYLPLDDGMLFGNSWPGALDILLWSGYLHLWYLNCSIIGFVIVWLLSKRLSSRSILAVSVIFLLAGCAKSTWAPLLFRLLRHPIHDFMGSRNGLFYAFPYIALGKWLAERQQRKKLPSRHKALAGFLLSLLLLVGESFVFVVYYRTRSTILWLSVLPLTGFLFAILLQTKSRISAGTSVFLRRVSALTYFIHPYLLRFFYLVLNLKFIPLFAAVAVSSLVLSGGIVLLSRRKAFRWLRYLY